MHAMRLACFVLLALGAVARADFPEHVLDVAYRSTVRIYDDGVASGVLIRQRGNEVFGLTAAHAVDSDHILVETFFPHRLITAKVVGRDKEQDLALFRFVSGDPLTCIPICPENEIPIGTIPVVTVGCSHGTNPTCVLTQVARRGNLWQTAAKGVNGRSGGPVVDERGYLIGIHQASDAIHGYARHTRSIHSFLEEEGYVWLAQRTSASRTSKSTAPSRTSRSPAIRSGAEIEVVICGNEMIIIVNGQRRYP